MEACAWILTESNARTNRHIEVQERILAEACGWMTKEACAKKFLLKARDCTEEYAHKYTSTDVSMVKTVICGKTCAYDNYGMNEPKHVSIELGRNHIGAEAVGTVKRGSATLTSYSRVQRDI